MSRKFLLISICLFFAVHSRVFAQEWSFAKASRWYKKQGWLVGANYTPAYAINQLEFWQEDTFNPVEIEKELSLAQSIGMNCMRVYLHHVLWANDAAGFKSRINQFLAVADRHKIKIMFVIFDDCWNDTYKSGVQPAAKPGIHNSGWLKDPGNRIQSDFPLEVQEMSKKEMDNALKLINSSPHFSKDKSGVRADRLLDTLELYVKDILKTFSSDKRILLWDLYNEPGQFDQHNKSLPLLKKVFSWARSVNPNQPLSSGVYEDSEKEITSFQIKSSDIITYHSYDKPDIHQRRIDSLNAISGGRPLLCTEYMARKRGSTFSSILPMLKKQNIGAINWGLVDGKTQTKYAWDEPLKDGSEPKLWFHEIFRKDLAPYDSSETLLIKELTKIK